MYQRIKDGFATVFGILFLVLLLPVIIIALVSFGIGALWRWIFRKLRHDPTLKLEQIVPGPEPTETTIELARAYFDELIQEMANETNGEVEDFKTKYSKWNSRDEDSFPWRDVTFKRRIATDHARVLFELRVEEIDKNGESTFSSYHDGDDQSLAGHISASVTMSHLQRKSFDLAIDYGHEAAYFCIAILKGDGKYNQQTDQLWCYIIASKMWMVKYQSEASSSYGVRKLYRSGRAREYWLDS